MPKCDEEESEMVVLVWLLMSWEYVGWWSRVSVINHLCVSLEQCLGVQRTWGTMNLYDITVEVVMWFSFVHLSCLECFYARFWSF